jgi:hypothetical protein
MYVVIPGPGPPGKALDSCQFYLIFANSAVYLVYVVLCFMQMWIHWIYGKKSPWSVAVDILNMQSRTGDKGWSSSMEFGRGIVDINSLL